MVRRKYCRRQELNLHGPLSPLGPEPMRLPIPPLRLDVFTMNPMTRSVKGNGEIEANANDAQGQRGSSMTSRCEGISLVR